MALLDEIYSRMERRLLAGRWILRGCDRTSGRGSATATLKRAGAAGSSELRVELRE